MPKLGSDIAQKVKEAGESSGFAPITPGRYRARLTEVKAGPASTGNPMWTWILEIVGPVEADGSGEPGTKHRGRKQFNNTVLIENSMWKVAEAFAAFGRDTDVDTDELIGEECDVQISNRTIERGARAGQTGDNVDAMLPTKALAERLAAAGEGGAAPAAAAASSGGGGAASTPPSSNLSDWG